MIITVKDKSTNKVIGTLNVGQSLAFDDIMHLIGAEFKSGIDGEGWYIGDILYDEKSILIR